MKNLNKMFLAAIVLVAFATKTNAQASATATASATIVTPISISSDVNMDFGNIAVQTAAGGTVQLSAAASPTRTLGGTGLTLPVVTGTVASAHFNVAGTASYAYNISLPGAASSLSDGSGHTMNADLWTASNSLSASTLSGLGADDFYVGATLHVAAGQAAGTYTTATPFSVTVNYN